MADRKALLRQLPKIDEVVARDELRAVAAPRWALVEAARREVDALRQAILAGRSSDTRLSSEAVARRAVDLARPSLRRVVNATGVAVHTNLGRAPLAAGAIARVAEVAGGYANLEYDLDAGRRGSRHGHPAAAIRALTGAADAVVVNNNAAAVMLGLAALAGGGEVVVSRGELVEIGGSFRIPDVMRLSGATLVEVGTTNKTRLADYEAAITDATRLLLKVHRSNFAIVGFTEEVGLAELVDLGRRRGVATMMDLGSGSLLDAAELGDLGLPAEPGVRATAATGVDLVTFSGDKLLGGPQAGILAGRAAAVDAARRHPLMRAVRPDKMTVAALEATLALYRDGRARDVPAVALLAAPIEVLRERAEELRAAVGRPGRGWTVELTACASAVGGGAMPTAELPSWGIAVAAGGSGPRPQAIDARLRAADVPVIARIADDRVVLDVRTLIAPDDLDLAAAAVRSLW